MSSVPRVAFFSDSFHEVNGVALTSRQLEAFARRRALPFLSVHCGPHTSFCAEDPVWTLQLRRGAAAFSVDRDLAFDPLLFRYWSNIRRALRAFRPDLIHITSPGDIGILGACSAWAMHIPLLASWHTNVHEFGAQRLANRLAWLGPSVRTRVAALAEKAILACVLQFYRRGHVLLAPNRELVELLGSRTGKLAFLMERGVDTGLFSPQRRDRSGGPFTLGYVGRLTPEKNVRFLADLERRLASDAGSEYRFVVVGDGSELDWLKSNLQHAEFPGVLTGEALARSYANMDVFVFPSRTDTYGNVVSEALASGVPAVVTDSGGPQFLVQSGVTGFVAESAEEFAQCVLKLTSDHELHTRMCTAARQGRLHQSWDRVFEGVYRAYAQCLLPAPAGLLPVRPARNRDRSR